ncbi:MAG: glycosyltransferase family 4 protein [Myxococcota bacterium]
MAKLLLLTKRLGHGSGTASVAYALAQGLHERGWPVEIWCDEPGNPPPGVSMNRGVHRAPRSDGLRIGLDRTPHCDVLRCSGGVHEAWRRVLRTDPTRFWRGLGPSRTSWAERHAMKSARVLVCNSEHVAHQVAQRYRPPQPLRVVRNGVDLERYRPSLEARNQARARWRVPSGGRVALFVAHGWFRKGFHAAVRAFARVAGPRDRLVVMGRDSRARQRLAWARRQLSQKLVAADGTDAVAALPGGDVLVHPTRYDASANVVLQAMACGVPPVTTLFDGAAEIVEDRRLIVANPDDDIAIAASIRHAWEARHTGARCHDVAKRWPTSRMVEGMATIVEELLHG